MEDVLVPLGALGLIGFIVHAIVSAIVRWRLISRQSQVLMRLVEGAGAVGAAGLLASPLGHTLLDGQVDRRTLVLYRVLVAVQAWIVLTIGGITLLLIRTRVTGDDERATLWLMGLLSVAIGLAFLLAASAAYALARRWGFLDVHASELPAAQ